MLGKRLITPFSCISESPLSRVVFHCCRHVIVGFYQCDWSSFISIVVCFFLLPNAVFSHIQMPMDQEVPAVRVNCRTPDLMIFQIFEPRVRALLRVPTGRSFQLFSEDPDTGSPIRNCSANYTITSAEPGWSTSFTFLNYAPNTSCLVRSFLVDKDRVAHHTYVADIFLKVLASDDGTGVGRRGRIRLTCTMLAMQKVTTKMTELRSDVSLPVQGSAPGGTQSPEISMETLSEKLEGSLMLRFFKRIPSSMVPVPAISISEGEEVYLVAALKTGSPFTVLRPINCTIRSMVSGSFRKDATAGIGEFIHGASRAGILVRESVILENGCQSDLSQWFIPTRPQGSTERRLYFTKFSAPTFTGSLRLNARCSINLCSASNAKSCLEQPQLMGPTCFTETEDVPQFQFRLETFTNITQYRPASTTPLPPSLRAQNNGHMGVPPFTGANTVRNGLAMHSTNDHISLIQTATSNSRDRGKMQLQNLMFPMVNTTVYSAIEWTNETIRNETLFHAEVRQEVKYCFLQKTVTMASVMVVVVLMLSLVLVLLAILSHCRRRKVQGGITVHSERLTDH